MCGIVGGVCQSDVLETLLSGLHRLEYRGYDSAGIALLCADGEFSHVRMLGKVSQLEQRLKQLQISATTGIAHTRWATHGKPSIKNAHPHLCQGEIALVHNGIIENHVALREQQIKYGYQFNSDTDTEVAVNQIHYYWRKKKDLLVALMAAAKDLEGAYALVVLVKGQPGRMLVMRQGSPLVIGLSPYGNYCASDIFALLPITGKFIILEEGDIADITLEQVCVYDRHQQLVQRSISQIPQAEEANDKAGYRHFMEKEIYSQPKAITNTLTSSIEDERVNEQIFSTDPNFFRNIKAVQIVACGTSYHAGLVACQWIEELAQIPARVEIASEFRYRDTVILPDTLLIAVSQSGETADTLAALRKAKEIGIAHQLAICNVPDSSLIHNSTYTYLTHAGREIGVASTKAFTTQLVGLLLTTILLARNSSLTVTKERALIRALFRLPADIEQVLKMSDKIKLLAERMVDKHHALYLGRGNFLPVAMEGALKLKEISYLHAEAHAAGELKHGPLALVDEDMPVIAVAPNNELLGKLQSNLSEVKARGGELYIITDSKMLDSAAANRDDEHIVLLPTVNKYLAPILYTIPLQLLAYHVATIKGLDVDQPRNLAKSVTVE